MYIHVSLKVLYVHVLHDWIYLLDLITYHVRTHIKEIRLFLLLCCMRLFFSRAAGVGAPAKGVSHGSGGEGHSAHQGRQHPAHTGPDAGREDWCSAAQERSDFSFFLLLFFFGSV